MTRDSGVVAAKALEVLDCQGHNRKAVAEALGVHPRTVRRWELGQYSPNRKNRTALRALLGQLLMVEYGRPETAQAKARIKRLNDAATALMTREEKAKAQAERDELTVKARQVHAEAQQRRSRELAERYALARAEVIRQRQANQNRISSAARAADAPPRSVIYQLADPWDAIPTEPALPF